jgi:hypothetical protein
MPYSSVEGKKFVQEWFADKTIQSVLDVGPGAGTYYDLLQPIIRAEWWTGLEVWAPYITQFALEQKYDEVIVADINYVDWNLLAFPDLVIFGDVLEHMPRPAAQRVLAKAQHRATYVVVSLPIIHYPQGAEMGNKWETHVTSWTDKMVRQVLLDEYAILAYDIGEVVGTYILEGDQR